MRSERARSNLPGFAELTGAFASEAEDEGVALFDASLAYPADLSVLRVFAVLSVAIVVRFFHWFAEAGYPRSSHDLEPPSPESGELVFEDQLYGGTTSVEAVKDEEALIQGSDARLQGLPGQTNAIHRSLAYATHPGVSENVLVQRAVGTGAGVLGAQLTQHAQQEVLDEGCFVAHDVILDENSSHGLSVSGVLLPESLGDTRGEGSLEP